MKVTQFDGWINKRGIKYIPGQVIKWDVGKKGSGFTIEIPANFEFDISVPRLLWWIRGPHYRPWLLASLIHDYLLLMGFDKAFAAGEWRRAAYAVNPNDSLVLLAYYGINFWTVRSKAQ